MDFSRCRNRLFVLINAFYFTYSPMLNAQVKLNEIMVRPGGNQGLIVFNGNSGNEYVELYNPSCTPVNVAGYFIACRQEFAGTTSGGAFRIPNVAAATIAPGGHLVLGTSTSSADPNSIDIKLPDFTSNYCLNNSGFNFILANADGWVALYDAAGTPVDAVYWSSNAANISQTADFGGVPCVPAGSPAGVNLESAQQINSGFPGVLSYGGPNPAAGVTFSRIPDGGNWQGGINPSINDLTVGNCNGGNCQTVSAINFTVTTLTPSCGTNNGSININVTSSGTATYVWSTNASTGNSATASSLAAGTYSVTITQNGCSRDTSITLTSANGVSVSLTNPVNPTCVGNDGSITINLAGGTAPYQVVIDTGGAPINITVPFAVNQTLGNLPSGTVSVSVTDAAGCISSASATLNAPGNCCTFSITANITNPNCGTSNGSIAINATNGSGNYTFGWSVNACTGNTSTANNLAAGQYQLTVTDNDYNNCFIDTFFILTNPNAPVLNNTVIINETCAGTNDGSITVAASGGSGTLTYTWSPNANTGNNNIANNLPSGTYTFTVTDSNNCLVTGNAIVQSGVCCTLQATATSSATSCGLSNGSIIAGIISGGQSPFVFQLNNGIAQPDSLFNNLASGTYTLIAIDAQGCADTLQIVVDSSNAISVNLQSTDVTCFGSTDGSINATASGSTGTVLFNWSNGQTNSFINNLTPGTYNVTITDATGCTATASSIVNQPAAIVVNLGNDTTLCSTGLVQFNAPAGFASYAWNNGSSGPSITVNNPGTYTLTVTNSDGCSATDNISLSINNELTLDLGEDITLYEDNTIGLFPVLNTTAAGQFNWTPAGSVSCASCQNTVATPSSTTQFILTYTGNNGCSVSDSILITVLEAGNLFFPTAFSPNGDGNNDIYRAFGNVAKVFRLKIFNRWGELVFETNNFNDGWDGTYKGKDQPIGVYVYTAELTLLNNNTRNYKGSVTLLR